MGRICQAHEFGKQFFTIWKLRVLRIARNARSMSVLNALRLSRVPALAFAIVGWFWGTFAAYVPELKATIGADDAQFGLILLGTSFGLMTTMILAPMLDARLGPRALPFAALFLAGAFLLPGLMTVPFLFFCAMALAGLGSGLLDVVMNARVSELEARHKRSLMNANHGVFSVSYACAAILTGLAREAGWPPVAMFAALGCLTLCAAFFLVMEVEAPSEEPAEARGVFPWNIVLLCGVVVLIAFMAEAAVESWSALHVERTLGGRAAEGALGPAMLGITMAIGRFSGQAVSERFDDYLVIFGAASLAVLGGIIAAIAPNPTWAYVGFGTIGLGVSVIGPLGLAIVGRLVRPSQRTKAISRAAVIGFSGFFVAPAAMGLVSDAYGLRVAFACISGLVLLLFLFTPLLRRRERLGSGEGIGPQTGEGTR